jgi:hypothetical protein
MSIQYRFGRNGQNRLTQEVTVTAEDGAEVQRQFDSIKPLWKHNDGEIIKEIERVKLIKAEGKKKVKKEVKK